MELTVSDKRIITPAKTIDGLGRSGEINEVSLKVDKEDVVAAFYGQKNRLNTLSSQINPDAINVVIPEYTSIGFITEKMDVLSKFESRIHANTDIIVVPRWKGVLSCSTQASLVDSLKTHSKQFIDESRILNGKLIMGNIPLSVPESVIDELVQFYLKEGITSFVLDYGTCLPRGKEHVVRGIQKTLLDSGDFESSILYSTNVRRTHKVGDMFPADDLMTFCHGIDLIGNLHIGGGSGSNDSKPEPATKKFVPSEYTYIEERGLSEAGKKSLKVQNCRAQNSETRRISEEIRENRTALRYIKDKIGAKEYVEGSKQKSISLDFSFSENRVSDRVWV